MQRGKAQRCQAGSMLGGSSPMCAHEYGGDERGCKLEAGERQEGEGEVEHAADGDEGEDVEAGHC